jgi:hypothetical protein
MIAFGNGGNCTRNNTAGSVVWIILGNEARLLPEPVFSGKSCANTTVFVDVLAVNVFTVRSRFPNLPGRLDVDNHDHVGRRSPFDRTSQGCL